MATRFQQLGAFSGDLRNLSDWHVSEFAKAGGKWVTALFDQLSGVNGDGVLYNRAHISNFKDLCEKYHVAPGIWVNGWGGNEINDSQAVIKLVKENNLGPVMLDLECPYQHMCQFKDPVTGQARIGDASKMPRLVKLIRQGLPTRSIIVSTNGMNASMIWNGRTLDPAQSFKDLGIRVAPQWYSYVWKDNNNYLPENQMRWLKENSADDFNFRDPDAPYKRGLPLSYVHGTLEVTGLENGDLTEEVFHLTKARAFGYTVGFSIYMLENIPEGDPHGDFKQLAALKGKLFLI